MMTDIDRELEAQDIAWENDLVPSIRCRFLESGGRTDCPAVGCCGPDDWGCVYCSAFAPPITDQWVSEHVNSPYRIPRATYDMFRFIQRVYQPRVTGKAQLPESGAMITWNEKRKSRGGA